MFLPSGCKDIVVCGKSSVPLTPSKNSIDCVGSNIFVVKTV